MTVDEYIEKVLEDCPPLTEAQKAVLAAVVAHPAGSER